MIVDDMWDIWNKVFLDENLKIQLHSNLQWEIKKLAEKYNYWGRIEYQTPQGRKEGIIGYIDVVWLIPYTRKPAIAFEIDNVRKKGSIRKLLNIDVKERYWLYYGRYANIELFTKEIDKENTITVIDLPYRRKPDEPKRVKYKSSGIDFYNGLI